MEPPQFLQNMKLEFSEKQIKSYVQGKIVLHVVFNMLYYFAGYIATNICKALCYDQCMSSWLVYILKHM